MKLIDTIWPHRKAVLFFWSPLLILMALVPSDAQAEMPSQAFAPNFEQTDCFFEVDTPFATAETLGFECGYVTVPEQHSVPDGPTIRLPVAVLQAVGPSPEPDPIFLAQGGPGGDAFGIFSITAPGSLLNQDRDIVIFNQRGTLYAEPQLDCRELFDNLPERIAAADEAEAVRLEEEGYAQCRERLVNEEGINLSAFDSLENARDIDLIREALGYDSYNFYGVSYGTLLGLHLMELDPPALRAVILDSVVPTQTNFVVEVSQTENRAYDEYLDACTSDTTCNTIYPDLEARVAALYEGLNANPVTMTLTNSDTGESFDGQVNGDSARGLIFSFFYIPDFYTVFPRMITDLERGEYDSFENLASLILFDDSISFGMYFSVLCAEDSDYNAEDVPVEGLRSFISENAVDDALSIRDSCLTWDVEQLDESVDDPVVSDIPTMLISGRFDPITPPAYAAAAAETLSNSYNVVNPLGSHGNIWGGDSCSVSIARDFLDDPMTVPDDSCYADQELLAAIDLDAIPVPLLGGIATFETDTVAQIVALAVLGVLLLSGVLLWPIAWIVRRLRNRSKEVMRPGARLAGRVLTLFTGAASLAMLGMLTAQVVNSFSNSGFLLYGVLPSDALTTFYLVPVIFLLALLGLFFMLRSWPDASIGGKVYQSFLMICLIAVSVLLFTLQLFAPLLA
ncbi:MAG: alpha/beta fold hydrolase [Chloroflexota bacterium]